MIIDLDAMTLDELKQLRKDIEKALAGYESRKKAEARVALEAKAREMGFTLSEITDAAPSRKKRAPVAAKYAHPDNPSVTWSGRGRKPGWISEALAAGRSLNEFLIA
jgi:DNA-binding protein H-NS